MGKGAVEQKEQAVALAIDKDKGSQYALKWAADNLLTKGQHLTLLHVKQMTALLPNQCKSLSHSCIIVRMIIMLVHIVVEHISY